MPGLRDKENTPYSHIREFSYGNAGNQLINSLYSWVKGEEGEDTFDSIYKGLRYSPKSVRLLIDFLTCRVGEYDDTGTVSLIKQFQSLEANNALMYGLLLGFVVHDEYKALVSRPLVDFPVHKIHEPEEIFLGLHPDVSNYILPGIEQTALVMNQLKETDPGVKSILFHGKFNGIPHADHIQFIFEALQIINRNYHVRPEHMCVIIACDTNAYIRSTNKRPFLTTAWRMSLMSYLPITDVICSSGYREGFDAEKFWGYKYGLLRPDFVPIEIGDVMSESKKIQAEHVNAIVIPVSPDVSHAGMHNRISSTHIQNGSIDSRDYIRRCQKLFDEMRLSWVRNWFENE